MLLTTMFVLAVATCAPGTMDQIGPNAAAPDESLPTIAVLMASGKPVGFADVIVRGGARQRTLLAMRTDARGRAVLARELAAGDYIVEVRVEEQVWTSPLRRGADEPTGTAYILELGGERGPFVTRAPTPTREVVKHLDLTPRPAATRPRP